MHVFWIILTCFSATFAFAFLITGWVTLLQVGDQEEAALKRQLAEARKQGWLQGELRALHWMYYEGFALRRLLEHWRTRPETRWLIYLGVLSLALAATAGYFTGAFK